MALARRLEDSELWCRLRDDADALDAFLKQYPYGIKQAVVLGIDREVWYRERKKYGIGYERGKHPTQIARLNLGRKRRHDRYKQLRLMSVEEYHAKFG